MTHVNIHRRQSKWPVEAHVKSTHLDREFCDDRWAFLSPWTCDHTVHSGMVFHRCEYGRVAPGHLASWSFYHTTNIGWGTGNCDVLEESLMTEVPHRCSLSRSTECSWHQMCPVHHRHQLSLNPATVRWIYRTVASQSEQLLHTTSPEHTGTQK